MPPMMTQETTGRAILDALDEPAVIVEGRMVAAANPAAKTLLGAAIELSDVRIAIRQPQVLEFVLAGQPGDVDFTGVGAVGRPWRLAARRLGDSQLLLRLFDRSAEVAAETLRVDFVANASHELRTPLTAVIGYAESLEDGDLDAGLTRQFASTIGREAKRMLRIIEDLMSLSRIEANRFVAPTEPVDLAAVIGASVDHLRAAAEHCGCDIRTDVEPSLPAIPGDFAQLVQLFDNLLGNAVRYGCAVDPCKVSLRATVDGSFVRLEVSDNGPGIPRQHLPFLTRRFYRVDEGRSKDKGGTGLGLAIVKHIVERHRGSLQIDSVVGRGTSVTVRLPAGR
jgi:two-component system phosphate regulon sensor histidine kinase PhoR